MEPLFLFSLLLTNLPATENCLSQSAQKTEWNTGEPALLSCKVSKACPEGEGRFEWFAFKENNKDYHVNVSGDTAKFSLVDGCLKILSLNVDDSGIYHCAAVWPNEPTQGRQYVGPGTTMIVKGKDKKFVKRILLWLSFVLLSIYSLAIISLIVVKKFGCNLSISRGVDKADKKNSTNKQTRKTQFRDVLEEMYGKKNLDKEKSAAGRNKVEAARTDFSNSTEDIYQNV